MRVPDADNILGNPSSSKWASVVYGVCILDVSKYIAISKSQCLESSISINQNQAMFNLFYIQQKKCRPAQQKIVGLARQNLREAPAQQHNFKRS